MIREPDNWSLLETYPDYLAAEAEAGYLRSEGIAARVRVISDIPGLDRCAARQRTGRAGC